MAKSCRFIVGALGVVLLELGPATRLHAQASQSASEGSSAPRTHIGVNAGIGDVSYLDDRPGSRKTVGVEACFSCDGRAYFVDYAHWTRPDAERTGYRSADTVMTR